MWIVSKEAVVGIVRTGIAYVYAALLGQFPAINDWLVNNELADSAQGFVSGGFVIVVGTVIYSAIRWAAEKWGWVGSLLVFNTKPEYATTSE